MVPQGCTSKNTHILVCQWPKWKKGGSDLIHFRPQKELLPAVFGTCVYVLRVGRRFLERFRIRETSRRKGA